MNPIGKLTQELVIGDFTDGESTTGYADFDSALPAGAIPLAWKATVATAFTGTAASATMQIGVSGDVDRFSAITTGSVFTAGTIGAAVVAADAVKGIASTVTPRVTITEATDFGKITAGAVTIDLYYIDAA